MDGLQMREGWKDEWKERERTDRTSRGITTEQTEARDRQNGSGWGWRTCAPTDACPCPFSPEPSPLEGAKPTRWFSAPQAGYL